jgi:hypothetical protein
MIDYLVMYLLGLLAIMCTVITLAMCFIGYMEIKDYFKNP